MNSSSESFGTQPCRPGSPENHVGYAQIKLSSLKDKKQSTIVILHVVQCLYDHLGHHVGMAGLFYGGVSND